MAYGFPHDATPAPRAKQTRKDGRLDIRVSQEDKVTLGQAAQICHQDTGEFVRQAAMKAAEATLAEASMVRLNPEQWKAFQERLDEEPRDLPALRALFSRPSVFAKAE